MHSASWTLSRDEDLEPFGHRVGEVELCGLHEALCFLSTMHQLSFRHFREGQRSLARCLQGEAIAEHSST